MKWSLPFHLRLLVVTCALWSLWHSSLACSAIKPVVFCGVELMLGNCDSSSCKWSLFMQLYSWNLTQNWFMAHESCWLIMCIFLVWSVIILCALFRCLESAVPLLSLQLKVVWCHLHSRKWDSPLLPLLKGGLLFCAVKGEKLLLLYMYMFAKWGKPQVFYCPCLVQSTFKVACRVSGRIIYGLQIEVQYLHQNSL